MGYCPNCGTEISDTDEFCRECGENLAQAPEDKESSKGNEVSAGGSMVYCRECGATISETADSCPQCGAKQHPRQSGTLQGPAVSMDKNPGLAAAGSFVIPGLGQVYNGQIGKGIVMGAVTIAFAITGIGLIIALPLWIYLVYDAYKVASGEERPWPSDAHPNTTPVNSEETSTENQVQESTQSQEDELTSEFEPVPTPRHDSESDPTRFRLDAPHIVGGIIIVFGVIATIRTPVGIPVLLVGIAVTPATRNWIKQVWSRFRSDDGEEEDGNKPDR